MAKRAGYSATTLSEAAGGVRRPSLDVTLAYVAVCGGDLDAWRLRWYDLSAAVARTARPKPTPPAPPPKPVARWQVSRCMLATAAIALIASAVVVFGPRLVGFRGAAADGCPAIHPAAIFTGKTYLYTHVRRAPTLAAPVLQTFPPGCTVGFSGFCLGDTIVDQNAQTPDIRWLMLPGGGVVTSTIIRGNPPDALVPSECRGGSSPPKTITLTVKADDRGLNLRATGVGLRIVGFAALYADNTGESRWHQIGFTGAVAPGFDLRWHPNRLSRPGERLTVAAAACLGGDGPTQVADARVVRRDAPQRVTAPRLPREALDAATRVACQYPINAGPRPFHSGSPRTTSPS